LRLVVILRSPSCGDLARLLDHGLEAGLVLDAVAAEDLHRVEALGLDQAEADRLHVEGVLDALHEAVLEVEGERERQFVDAPLLDQVVPEQRGGGLRRLALRRDAEAVGVVGEAVHDVGDRQLARAAHDAVVAGGAHPHRVGAEHFLALAGADHHEDFLRRVRPGVAERAGAGADAALHAHAHPVAFLDVGLDFLEEAVLVLRDGGLVRGGHRHALLSRSPSWATVRFP
jgi:hypothetical protein